MFNNGQCKCGTNSHKNQKLKSNTQSCCVALVKYQCDMIFWFWRETGWVNERAYRIRWTMIYVYDYGMKVALDAKYTNKMREKRQSCKKTNDDDNDDYDDVEKRTDWRATEVHCFCFFYCTFFLQCCGWANASFSLWPTTSTVEQHLVCYTLLLLLLPLVLLCKIMRIRINSPWSTIASTLLMHLTNIIMEIMHKCDLITFKRR